MQSGHARSQFSQRSFVEQYVICSRQPRCAIGLGPENRHSRRFIDARSHPHTRQLRGLAAIDDQHALNALFPVAGLDQQRNDQDDVWRFRGERARASICLRSHTGVQHSLEPAANIGIVKCAGAHPCPVQSAIDCHGLGAELVPKFGDCCTARSDQFVYQLVRVDDPGSKVLQHRGDGTLAAAGASGEPDAVVRHQLGMKMPVNRWPASMTIKPAVAR